MEKTKLIIIYDKWGDGTWRCGNCKHPAIFDLATDKMDNPCPHCGIILEEMKEEIDNL